MGIWWILGVCCLVQLTQAYDWQKYEDYKIISAVPHTKEGLDKLRSIQRNTGHRFIDDPSQLGREVSFLSHPSNADSTWHELLHAGVDAVIKDNYLTPLMKEEWERLSERNQAVYNYTDFNDYDTTIAELDNLAASCDPAFTCTVSTIGYSVEGRAINMLEIKKAGNNKTMWMDSNIHAREWLSPATVMNIFRKIIREYPTGEGNALMTSYNWYYVPMMNPDGYQFSWDEDRMWRKNRRDNTEAACFGVDLNRNWNFNWGGPGASPLPCSDTYFGTSAASEPETTAVQNRALAITEPIAAWWSVHTYGPYLLSPYGNCTLPPTSSEIAFATALTCTAIQDTYNTEWKCGNSCEQLYETSGTTSDWAFESMNVPYSYTPELRGNPGFVTPPSEIELSYTEVWNGLVALLSHLHEVME